MLNANVNDNSSRIEIQGSVKDLAVDAALILNSVYSSLYDASPAQADEFRAAFSVLIAQHGDDVFCRQERTGVMIVLPSGRGRRDA